MPDHTATIPQWTPTQRELDDLDLILNGCFEPPLAGFVDPGTAGDASPITLVVTAAVSEVATGVGKVDLIDPEGAPLARMTVTGTWDAGGTGTGLVGPVSRLAPNHFGPFRRLHLSPDAVHGEAEPVSLLAVAVTRPLTSADLESIDAAAAADKDLTPLLLACVGDGMPYGVSGPALVRATLEAAELLDAPALVVAVSAADHGWHEQHGDWTSANDWLLTSVTAAYAPNSIRLPRQAEGVPPDQVANIVSRDRPPRDQQGVVIFFTGLSGSGKSTLARALVDHILERGDRTVTSLDGDVVRHHLSKGLGFSREDRETNILRIGFVAAEIARNHGLAICSPIAPFDATRQAVRQMVERAGGGFVLVHVSTPLEECERRDRKGLYAKARRGELPDFTGISSPYEQPPNAFKVDTTNRDSAECLDELTVYLAAEGWL